MDEWFKRLNVSHIHSPWFVAHETDYHPLFSATNRGIKVKVKSERLLCGNDSNNFIKGAAYVAPFFVYVRGLIQLL